MFTNRKIDRATPILVSVSISGPIPAFIDCIGIGHVKTHDSESRGQEEAGHTRQMSVLFTGSTGMKFVNTLNYQGLSTF